MQSKMVAFLQLAARQTAEHTPETAIIRIKTQCRQDIL